MLTLDGVREEIDRVDNDMKALFMKRMGLADQVAQIKADTGDVIFKPDREKVMIEKLCADMDDALVMEYRAFLKRIIALSRKYQYRRMLELKGGFPYEYVTGEPFCRNVAVLAEGLQENSCLAGAGEASAAYSGMGEGIVLTAVNSYGEMGQRILEGKAEAGIGILEEMGGDASDKLHTLLIRCGLYIYKCKIRQTEGACQKVVFFGRKLVVRPEHNRLKLAFVCPDTRGSLANVLSVIADYDFNLTEIRSVPFREKGGWKYRFFAEMEMNLGEEHARALICQLFQETEDLRLLGSYCGEGDFI